MFMGQRMEKTGSAKTKKGFESEVPIYQAKRCERYSLRGICHDSKENPQIKVNHNLNRLRAKARDLLLSEQGIQYRKLRCIEPESVFGQLKSNNSFNRMKMRGIPKVEIDLGLAIIGHNLRKIVAKKNTSKTNGLKTQLKADLEAFLNPIRAFLASHYEIQINLFDSKPKSYLKLSRF